MKKPYILAPLMVATLGWSASSLASADLDDDSYAAAATMTLITPVVGEAGIQASHVGESIDTAGDEDWYKIAPGVGETGTLVIETSLLGDTDGVLYADNGTTQLAWDDDSGKDKNFQITVDLSASTVYYLKVKHYDSATTGAYDLTYSYTATPGDDGDNNRNVATDLTSDIGSSAGPYNFYKNGDVDYFEVTIAGANSVTIESTGSEDTYARLFDDSGTLVSEDGNPLVSDDDGGTDRNFKLTTPAVAGTYYLKVSHYAKQTGSYGIDVGALVGAATDDIIIGAVPPVVQTEGTTALRNIDLPGDVDYFALEILAGQQLTVSSADTGSFTDTYAEVFEGSYETAKIGLAVGASPLSVTAGSNVVTINHATHGKLFDTTDDGDTINLTGLEVGTTGINSDALNGIYPVTVIDANNYSITLANPVTGPRRAGNTSVTTMSVPATNNVVTITTAAAHSLATLDWIKLSGFGVLSTGLDATEVNALHQVAFVDATNFTITLTTASNGTGGNLTTSGVAEYYDKVATAGAATSGSANVVITAPHALQVGDAVRLSGFGVLATGLVKSELNALHEVTAISTTVDFTIAVTNNATSSGAIDVTSGLISGYDSSSLASFGGAAGKVDFYTDGSKMDKPLLSNDDVSDTDTNFSLVVANTSGATKTYTLFVRHFSKSGTGDYDLTISAESAVAVVSNVEASTRVEATGDAATTAVCTAAEIGLAGEIDFFKLTGPAATNTLVAYSKGGIDLIGKMLNVGDTILSYNDDGGAGQNFQLTQVSAGATDYYVRAAAYSPVGVGFYSLCQVIDDGTGSADSNITIGESETTTGADTAFGAGLDLLDGSVATTWSKALAIGGDVDIYKVLIDNAGGAWGGTGTLTVFTTGTTDTVIELLDNTGAQVANSDDDTDHNARLNFTASKTDVHYIRVRHASPLGVGAYTLSAKVTVTAP